MIGDVFRQTWRGTVTDKNEFIQWVWRGFVHDQFNDLFVTQFVSVDPLAVRERLNLFRFHFRQFAYAVSFTETLVFDFDVFGFGFSGVAFVFFLRRFFDVFANCNMRHCFGKRHHAGVTLAKIVRRQCCGVVEEHNAVVRCPA